MFGVKHYGLFFFFACWSLRFLRYLGGSGTCLNSWVERDIYYSCSFAHSPFTLAADVHGLEQIVFQEGQKRKKSFLIWKRKANGAHWTELNASYSIVQWHLLHKRLKTHARGIQEWPIQNESAGNYEQGTVRDVKGSKFPIGWRRKYQIKRIFKLQLPWVQKLRILMNQKNGTSSGLTFYQKNIYMAGSTRHHILG